MMKLNEFFKEYPETAVAFSGGVDSAYLFICCKKICKKVLCVLCKNSLSARI